jgi:sulfoquinovose isomerase
MTPESTVASAARWTALPYHRIWLLDQASGLFDFFERHSINLAGGFFYLDDQGRPITQSLSSGAASSREIHSTTRMVHSFAIARLIGRPGAEAFIDHGMDFLWRGHCDTRDGGYYWGIGDDVRATTASRPMAMPSCSRPRRAPRSSPILMPISCLSM